MVSAGHCKARFQTDVKGLARGRERAKTVNGGLEMREQVR